MEHGATNNIRSAQLTTTITTTTFLCVAVNVVAVAVAFEWVSGICVSVPIFRLLFSFVWLQSMLPCYSAHRDIYIFNVALFIAA